MKQLLLLLVITFLISSKTYAQKKVAGYSLGDPARDDYEGFSFWVEANKRSDIYYFYGKNRKEVKLRFIGKDILNGDSCFKVQFSNNYILYITPKDYRLRASDSTGKYSKYFSWENEGPVNGIGTFCTPCAENEIEAMKLIRLYYLR